MRDLGEVADRRDARARHLELERRDERRRHAQDARRSGRRRRRAAGRAPTRCRGSGPGRVCGTAAGIAPRLIHSATPRRAGQLDRGGHELAPAVVGLRPDEHEQVAIADPDVPEHELGPGQLREAAVDDLERRAARAVVEERGRHRRSRSTGASSASCSSAVVAADPASTQPSKAATKDRRDRDHRDRRGGRGSRAKDRRSPAEDLTARHDEPAVGLRGPVAPRLGDPLELVAVRQPGGERAVRERRLGHPVGPQAAPPGPVVGASRSTTCSPTASRRRSRRHAPRRAGVARRSARRRCGGRPGRTARPIGRGRGSAGYQVIAA